MMISTYFNEKKMNISIITINKIQYNYIQKVLNKDDAHNIFKQFTNIISIKP